MTQASHFFFLKNEWSELSHEVEQMAAYVANDTNGYF